MSTEIIIDTMDTLPAATSQTATADLTTRKSHLLSLIDAEAEQHSLWSEGDEPVPDADYWDALEAMLDGWQEGEIPGELIHVARAADRLGEAYEAFNITGASLPPRSFWLARGEVIDARHKEPPKLRPLDSPAKLVEQGVTHRQIAKIWKLLDERENPRVDLVQQELDRPGSVLTADYIAQVDARRMADAGFGLPAERRERPKPPTHEHAAGLEELIIQRVPLDQILRIKSQQYATDFPGPAVVLLAKAMGIEIPMSMAEVLNAAGASDIAKFGGGPDVAKVPLNTVAVLEEGREIGTTPPEIDEADEGQPIEEQVIDLFTAGHDAKAIAQHTGLPKKKVEQIIREFDGGDTEDER